MVDVAFIDVTEPLVEGLWPEIEPWQKREAAAVGITDDNYLQLIRPPFFQSVGTADGIPVCVFGSLKYDSNTVGVCLFTSYKARRWPLELTKMAKAYVTVLGSDNPECRIFCLPGDWEPKSIRWLEIVGFRHTGQYQEGVNGDQLAIMEY